MSSLLLGVRGEDLACAKLAADGEVEADEEEVDEVGQAGETAGARIDTTATRCESRAARRGDDVRVRFSRARRRRRWAHGDALGHRRGARARSVRELRRPA